MNSRTRLWAGVLLVLLSFVGLALTVRSFDASSASRDVNVREATDWHALGGGERAEVPLGRFYLPAPGVLRAVVCPQPVSDRHAVLRVTTDTGAPRGEEALKEDESRGKRCFDASFRANEAGWVRAALVVPTVAARRGIAKVETSASLRLTPWSMWPVLALLLGFVCVGTARDGAQGDREDPREGEGTAGAAPPSPPVDAGAPTAADLGYPPGLVGGIVPAGMIPPGTLPEGFVADPTAAPAMTPWVAPPPVEDRRPLVDRPWSGLYAVLGYFAAYAATIVASVLYIWLSGRGTAVAETGSFTAYTMLVQHGFMALVAAWFLGAFQARDPRVALGLVPMKPWEAARAVGLALALVGLAAVCTHFIKDVSQSPMGKMVEHVPVRFAIGFGALLAPVTEELFFRGVLVRAFGKQSLVVGVVVGAVLFTLAHALQLQGAWVGLIPICAVALVNGWLRATTGGITQPWLVHTVYNLALSAGLYFG